MAFEKWKKVAKFKKAKVVKAKTTKRVDMDKLARAVAFAESGNCTKWDWVEKNNCFWIMQWDSEWQRELKEYSTKEESFEDFKKLWKEKYWWMPDLKKAIRYTWNERPHEWLWIVNKYYYGK